MCAPPDWTGKSKEKNLAWAAEIYSRSPQTIQKILETTLNSFKAKYANTPEPQQLFKINSEICLDLVSMQHQLAIMTRYRRYVVIRAPGEVQPSYTPGVSLQPFLTTVPTNIFSAVGMGYNPGLWFWG